MYCDNSFEFIYEIVFFVVVFVLIKNKIIGFILEYVCFINIICLCVKILIVLINVSEYRGFI